MKGKLIKVDDVYRLVEETKHGNSIIGTTDLDYQKSWSDRCQKLSIKNCQAIERGYDLDELARQEAEKIHIKSSHEDWDVWECLVREEAHSIKIGMVKMLELMGDKKFSEEDLRCSWEYGNSLGLTGGAGPGDFENYIHREYLQQTEWDVEIEMWFHGTRHKKGEWIPRLDADGCLILKRI